MLTVGSLFAGIGGFDLGFERAGMQTKWFCEIDPFCQRVLAKHWPGVPCYPDITQLRASDLEPVDVLCGGFPCQDISVAGKGMGLVGARSGLWSQFARLVGELRPRYVVVENVPALRTRGLETVLADLLACGYDAEWDGLPASAFGAYHQRDRIWIVAYPEGERCGRWRLSEAPSQPMEPPGLGTPAVRPRWPQSLPVGVADGVPNRVDRLRSLGNALVPQVAQWIGEQIVRYECIS